MTQFNNNQQDTPAVSYPAQGQAYPTTSYVSAPPPMGYPNKDSPIGYPQQSVPDQTTTKGDGFCKGCCAALCCCWVLDCCF